LPTTSNGAALHALKTRAKWAGFRLSPEAEAELDDIWLYVARESGSIEIGNRLIDSITERFWLLAQHPRIGRPRDDLRPGLRSFALGRMCHHLPHRRRRRADSARHAREPGYHDAVG